MPEGQIRVLMEGLQRVEIRYFIEDGNYFKVAVEPRESIVTHDMETEALRRSVLDFFENTSGCPRRSRTKSSAR